MKNITLRLSNLYFLHFTKKYEYDTKIFKFLVYSILSLITLTYFISVPILFIVWLGMLISRKKYVNLLYQFILKQKLLNKIIYVIIISFVMFLLISMLFTIPIFILLIIGNKIENNKYKFKIKKSKKSMLFANSNDYEQKNVYTKVRL